MKLRHVSKRLVSSTLAGFKAKGKYITRCSRETLVFQVQDLSAFL